MSSRMETTSAATFATGSAVPAGKLRAAVDSFVCVALAVILFRTFEVEGYMISTGSMAPFLLGYHKRIECPACGHRFALGISEEEAGRASLPGSGAQEWSPLVECPNCGRSRLDVRHIPPNQGDQLLVHKHAYSFQPPRRWDIVVFRNPNKPSQAYVKRVVGLPGESLQLRDGDVYVNGRIERKDLAAQHSVRILVHDDAYRPRRDPGWQERWLPERADSGWVRRGEGFLCGGAPAHSASAPAEWDWVSYRHWIRAGGTHVTSVKAPASAGALFEQPAESAPNREPPHPAGASPVRYDAAKQQLYCRGVMSDDWRERLLARAGDPELRAAIERLADQSHLAPVTDEYAYNRAAAGTSHAVRDLMISAELTVGRGSGEFAMQMTDGSDVYSCVIDAGRRRIELQLAGRAEPLRSAALSPAELSRPMVLEMSLMDRQVLAAVNGRTVFAPWLMEEWGSAAGDGPRRPVRFGVRGLQVRVASLKLYRDVYYTGDDHLHAVAEPQRLAADEYFVLGDNSPVSLDSRSWPSAGVKSHLLMGKPFLVHLPSQPGKIRIGRYVAYIRIPDVQRMRYIR